MNAAFTTALLALALEAPGAARAQEWPQFLGPNRNGSTAESPWPGPPPSRAGFTMLWKREAGAGFSAPVLSRNRLILFHRAGDREIVECLDAATGRKLWSQDYPTGYRDDFGFDEGPRATPAIDGERVYTFGAEGMLSALDFATGRKLWSIDTHRRFAVPKGFFGAACSPLVEGGRVVVNVGGPRDAGLAAFEAASGRVAWTATGDEASYSSPVAVTLGGVRVVLCVTRAGLVGVNPADGSVRFRFPWRSRSHASVNAAAPVVAGNLVFLSASYGTGAVLLEASPDGVKSLWSSDESLSNHYATSVHRDGSLFGFHGRQESGQSLRAIQMRTGKVLWNVDSFGAGTLTLAGPYLLVVRENGELVVAEASPAGFRPLRRGPLLGGTVRAYPAVAGSRIWIRNENTVACFRLD